MTGSPADLYLDLLARTLTGMTYEDPPLPMPWLKDAGYRLAHAGYQPVPGDYQSVWRMAGCDCPRHAPCMIGLERLGNVRSCVQQALDDGIPGDLAETGVWRGGTVIYMRALLRLAGEESRDVWVIDSFTGLPGAAEDQAFLAVPLEEVRHNFELYGMLDSQVRFLPGWFADTLPDAPVKQLAVLRFDGDLYESARDVLAHLYPKLSEGGFLIVDDSHFPDVDRAVREYRNEHGITAPYIQAGPYCAYWRKED